LKSNVRLLAWGAFAKIAENGPIHSCINLRDFPIAMQTGNSGVNT
jgi:hypothetical protein